MSALLAVGPILLCRPIYAWIEAATSYNQIKSITDFRPHLVFVGSMLPLIHGYPFQVEEARQPTENAFSYDGSGTGRAVVALSCTLNEDHTEHDGQCGLPISILSFTAGKNRSHGLIGPLLGIVTRFRGRIVV